MIIEKVDFYTLLSDWHSLSFLPNPILDRIRKDQTKPIFSTGDSSSAQKFTQGEASAVFFKSIEMSKDTNQVDLHLFVFTGFY